MEVVLIIFCPSKLLSGKTVLPEIFFHVSTQKLIVFTFSRRIINDITADWKFVTVTPVLNEIINKSARPKTLSVKE